MLLIAYAMCVEILFYMYAHVAMISFSAAYI